MDKQCGIERLIQLAVASSSSTCVDPCQYTAGHFPHVVFFSLMLCDPLSFRFIVVICQTPCRSHPLTSGRKSPFLQYYWRPDVNDVDRQVGFRPQVSRSRDKCQFIVDVGVDTCHETCRAA